MAAEWIPVIFAAATLQLLALPGEKGQLVIASLATKYRPVTVVAGASTAFGLWTVVEIVLGNALIDVFSEAYLDAGTAILFLVFAIWLWITATREPSLEIDGYAEHLAEDVLGTTHLSHRLPTGAAGFLPAFALMLLGEFGDKTQLVTIALAVQYGMHPGIWIGEMLVIIPFSFATALVFNRVATRINQQRVHRGAALLFLLFGVDIVASHLVGVSLLPL